MKKILFVLIALFLTAGAFAQDGKSIYRKYSDDENVSAVYISPAMFRLMGNLPGMTMEGKDGEKVDIAPVVRKLSGFYLITTENPEIKSALYNDVDRFIGKGRYELLMEAKDDGETVRFYTVGNEKIVSSLVLLAQDGEETTFICLDGEIPQDDLNMILEQAY